MTIATWKVTMLTSRYDGDMDDPFMLNLLVTVCHPAQVHHLQVLCLTSFSALVVP